MGYYFLLPLPCWIGPRDVPFPEDRGRWHETSKGYFPLSNLMKQNSLILVPVLCAFALAACDTKRENARENDLERKADSLEEKAGVVRDEKEKVADAIEKNDPGANSGATEDAAKATRKTGEQTADALEEAAKREREKK